MRVCWSLDACVASQEPRRTTVEWLSKRLPGQGHPSSRYCASIRHDHTLAVAKNRSLHLCIAASSCACTGQARRPAPVAAVSQRLKLAFGSCIYGVRMSRPYARDDAHTVRRAVVHMKTGAGEPRCTGHVVAYCSLV